MSIKQLYQRNLESGDFISWKKNIPINYSAFVGRILEWSSLTCQFLQSNQNSDDAILKNQQILFGTNNPKKEENFLIIGDIRYYNQQYKGDDAKQKLNQTFTDHFKSLQIIKKIPHKGPVLKARAMPSDNSIIATRSSNNNIYLYDTKKKDEENQQATPMVFKEHLMQGSTLDWKKDQPEFITSSFDGQICIWDVNKQPQKLITEKQDEVQMFIEPILKYNYHLKPITDVKFHNFQQNFFGYTTDHHVVFQDSREGKTKPFMNILAHIDETTCLDFSPHDQFLLLSGAKTGRIKLWDMRKMNLSLVDLEHCQEEILKVQWSPNLEMVFASSSSQNQIKLWDLSQIDLENKKKKIDFLNHNGHKGLITDFDWNHEQELSLLSTDSKNQLHYWQVKQNNFYKNEQDQINQNYNNKSQIFNNIFFYYGIKSIEKFFNFVYKYL